MEEKKYNLIYERWLPIAGGKSISLAELFNNNDVPNLGGNIVEIISILRFLLAISQRAFTPRDENEWRFTDIETFKGKVWEYLECNEDMFYLYHPQYPFLQVKDIANTTKKPFSILNILLPSDNAPILTDFQQMKTDISDEEKAILLLTALNFALSSKRGNSKKEGGDGKALPPGPAIGKKGYVHVFFMGNSLIETIYANLLTEEEIKDLPGMKYGLGSPIWEILSQNNGRIPENRDTIVHSYLGRLVPLTRSILLANDGVYYRRGIDYPGPDNGIFEPTMTIVTNEKKGTHYALTVNPVRKPWRDLSASLCTAVGRKKRGYSCPVINLCLRRAIERFGNIDVVAGGIKVSFNSGEAFVSGEDDFVLSRIPLRREDMQETEFDVFEDMVKKLSDIVGKLKSAIRGYARDLTMKKESKSLENMAEHRFWDRMDRMVKDIVMASFGTEKDRDRLYFRVLKIADEIYSDVCPHASAREFLAWVKNKPLL